VASISNGFLNQAKLASAVQRAAKALSGDVAHIYYGLESDWMGNPSIFFKIVLRDKASKPENLREVARRVRLKLTNEAKIDQSDLNAYFSFRSQSELAKMRDPAWA
jgi:hypothetical protein